MECEKYTYELLEEEEEDNCQQPNGSSLPKQGASVQVDAI